MRHEIGFGANDVWNYSYPPYMPHPAYYNRFFGNKYSHDEKWLDASLPVENVVPVKIYTVLNYARREVVYKGVDRVHAYELFNRQQQLDWKRNDQYGISVADILPEDNFRVVLDGDRYVVKDGEDCTKRCLFFVHIARGDSFDLIEDETTATIIRNCGVNAIVLFEPGQSIAWSINSHNPLWPSWRGSNRFDEKLKYVWGDGKFE